MIVIIDYGVGNLASIEKMLRKATREKVVLSSDPDHIASAKKLILPGVGPFDHGIKSLDYSGLRPILTQRVVDDKIPILGICLGMQLFTNRSREGHLPGLGWIAGTTERFQLSANSVLKVPHMGWNWVDWQQDAPLSRGLRNDARFYFVHSYYVVCDNDKHSIATSHHGHTFTASVARDNIFGVQFHPEKSHKYGLQLMKNFAEI